jgi:hypothetical protein
VISRNSLLFQNAAVPSGSLTCKQRLSDDQFDRLKIKYVGRFKVSIMLEKRLGLSIWVVTWWKKGVIKKFRLRVTGYSLFSITTIPPPKLVGMLKRMKANVNYLTPGYLMSLLMPHASEIVLRRWRRTLRQLLNVLKEAQSIKYNQFCPLLAQ